MPSAATLGADEAVASAEAREDGVRQASALLDKDVMYFVEQFVLPRDREQWAQEYGVQLAAQHGAYLQQVREEIRLQSHNLRMFHARPDHAREEDPFGLGDLSNLDAMSKLVTLVLTAVRHSRRMSSLHGEFTVVQRRVQENGSLALADRMFLKKSLPGVVAIMARMNVQTKELQDKLTDLKQPFHLLCDQDEVSACVTRLLSGQITASSFAESAGQPFAQLIRLTQRREEIVQKAADTAISQALDWLSFPNGRVPLGTFDEEVKSYKRLLDAVMEQKVVHDRSVNDLLALHERANGWPLSVVGPNGDEITLEVIRDTMKEYEWITERSYQIIEAVLPINKTLEAFIVEFREMLG